MGALIQQKVKFSVPAKRLFDIYFSSKEHSAATGATAKIQKKVGSPFSAWDGYCFGKILHFVEGKCVIQTWRAEDWDKTDEDSLLMIFFRNSGKGCELEMVHTNVPPQHAPGLKKGWVEYYWKPLKEYLKAG